MGPCVNVWGYGHSMALASNPSGSVHLMRVGRPESPGLFQYVCHPRSIFSRRPSQKGSLGRMDSCSETSSAWTCRDAEAATPAQATTSAAARHA